MLLRSDKLQLKLLYFIVDPTVNLVSKTNIDTFFDEVDRSSPSTKLKSLIDEINFFMCEVEYKSAFLKKKEKKRGGGVCVGIGVHRCV